MMNKVINNSFFHSGNLLVKISVAATAMMASNIIDSPMLS